jgi:hypothetical protein
MTANNSSDLVRDYDALETEVNGYQIKAGANLSDANLSGANLGGADLSGVNLSGANLSGVLGLLDAADWISQNLALDPDGRGYIAYKVFGGSYPPSARWSITPGSILTEVVNPCPTCDCASGINVATLVWVRATYPSAVVWRVLIRYEWLASVAVPYATDGKLRCSRIELLGIVDAEAANG